MAAESSCFPALVSNVCCSIMRKRSECISQACLNCEHVKFRKCHPMFRRQLFLDIVIQNETKEAQVYVTLFKVTRFYQIGSTTLERILPFIEVKRRRRFFFICLEIWLLKVKQNVSHFYGGKFQCQRRTLGQGGCLTLIRHA